MDNEQLKSNLTSSKHWLRLVFMLLFAAVLQLASLVMWVLVIIQFLFSLITGEDNQHLRRFGHSLSTYIYDVLKFLCYSSEEKPFPFADWPTSNIGAEENSEVAPPPVPTPVATNDPAEKAAE
ncbi:MAG TPA: DUF4389 domain-containing protein [Cellvibrio sp.]